MWNAFAHYFAKLMTLVWFAGVVIMIATIPCCIYKIFSALWEPDDPEEHQAVTERPRR